MTTTARPRSSLNRRPQFTERRVPPVPETLEDTGLSAETLSDLLLKTLYVQGARTGQLLTDTIRLPFALLDERLLDLQQRQFVEVRGAKGHGRGGYTFDLTGKGRERAREAMDSNQYVGPAPVPMVKYREWVEAQSIKGVRVTREGIEVGFSHLVLDPKFLEQLGPAINSAKSMFLYGDSGNGKTNLAESIARMMGGDLFVPYAVDVDGHVMVVYDPVHHRALPEGRVNGNASEDWLEPVHVYDRRFARVQRPVVFTGGELTLDQLELQYDSHSKVYQAPFQVKANGGVLIIDDFGRQRVRPRDLLNRWIVPLEKRMDFLTLHTGHKFPVPFDCLLIFATNLDPLDLVDEAFLRRIHYKIFVPSPTQEDYRKIFRRVCVSRQISYDNAAVDWIYKNFYGRLGIQPRSCHPRDVVDHLCDFARFTDAEPVLSDALLQGACASYFLDMPDGGGEEGATVVAADANADEQVEPDPVDLAAALARAAAEAAAASAADGPRDSAGL
ncbi:MAG TPA: ATP-binding protein [Gemmatimonadota bacterium]|nr:ATP-binding protein [Gemmatimonadota bacterium]